MVYGVHEGFEVERCGVIRPTDSALRETHVAEIPPDERSAFAQSS